MNEIKRNQVREALEIIIRQIENAPDKDINDKALIAVLIAVQGSIIERDEIGLMEYCKEFASRRKFLRSVKAL